MVARRWRGAVGWGNGGIVFGQVCEKWFGRVFRYIGAGARKGAPLHSWPLVFAKLRASGVCRRLLT